MKNRADARFFCCWQGLCINAALCVYNVPFTLHFRRFRNVRFHNFSFLPTENTVSASFRLSPAGKCFLSFFRFCRQMPFALSPVLPAKCRKHCFNILFRSCLLELNGLGNSILVGITKFDSAHRAAGKLLLVSYFYIMR